MRTAQDSLRQHMARQTVLGERDKLLHGGNKKTGLTGKLFQDDGKDGARAFLISLALASAGLVPYMVMVLMWFFVYHKSFPNTLGALIALVIVSVLMVVGSQKKVLGRDRAWLRWLGTLWALATLVGTVTGFLCYFRALAYYWKYEEMRTYTNVAASQDADAFGDGGMFLFTEDTHLDPMRSVGYSSRWTGQTYCAAPIVDSTMGNDQNIYYWAIGENCCSPRAEFHCDDSEDFHRGSALVVLEPEDVVRPFMRWAVQGAAYPKYEAAIRLQEASYFTKAATKPKLIRWSHDPIALKNSYYDAAVTAVGWVSGFYVALTYVGTFFVALRLLPTQKKDGVIR